MKMSALVHQVALVSESNRVKLPDMMRVSAALQQQASRDLEPIWEITATVDAFASLEAVPDGYWPMIIKDNIGTPGAAAFTWIRTASRLHSSPQAILSTGSLTASHEMCEMLVDPSGDKQATGDSPMPGQERVSFLVEVCDPSEAADFAYSVNAILVSDFYTPNYFDPMSASGVRYSFTGAITQPRQVLRGGYLSWKDSVSGHWWQEIWFEGGQPSFRDIGAADAKAGSIRAFVDRITEADTAKAIARGRTNADKAGLTVLEARASLVANAAMWHDQINAILGLSPRRGPAARRQRARRKRT